MNHNICIAIVSRICIVWACIASTSFSYGMEKNKRFYLREPLDFENTLPDHDFIHEEHPLLTQQFKTLMFSDQSTPLSLKKIFDDPAGVWSLHEGCKVNNACGLACIAALEGNHKCARKLFKDAVDQGSSWAMHSLGIYELGDLNAAMASIYFQQAYQNDSYRIAKERGLSDAQAIRSHRQVMAMLGFPAQKKLNFLTMLDEKIIQSSGKSIADLIPSLARCAQDVGDNNALEMCMNWGKPEAISVVQSTPHSPEQKPLTKPEEVIHQKPVFFKPILDEPQEWVKPISPIKDSAHKNPLNAVDQTACKKIDYSKMSPKQLQNAKAANKQKLSASTDESEALIERALIDEARLAKVTHDSQRIPILKEMAQYGHPDACYQLASHYATKRNPSQTEQQQQWQLLQQAADNDHPRAIYDFIINGFSSENYEQKATAAEYAQRLFDDPMRLKSIALSQQDLSILYRDYGAYFVTTHNDSKAVEFLQKAADLRDDTHAYKLAELYEKAGNFNKAQTYYRLVEGEKRFLAQWSNSVLEYSSIQDPQKRNELLQTWSKQCLGNDTHVLLHNDIAFRLKHDRVQARLRTDSESGSELASFVLAFCAQNEIAHERSESVSNVAFGYCSKSIEQSRNKKNVACEYASILMLKQLAESGNKDAQYYLRKHAPTEEQKVLDSLYKKESNHAQILSKAQLNALEKDIESSNPELALEAHALMAGHYMRQARDAKDERQNDKAFELYEKAVECLCPGVLKAQNLLEHPAKLKINALMPDALIALAEVTKNPKNKAHHYKNAANWITPSLPACVWMYRYNGDESYLNRAVEARYPEALLIKAQKISEQNLVEAQKYVDEVFALLAQDNNCLSNELKRLLYRLKAELTQDQQEKIEWQSKAVEVGEPQWAFEIAQRHIKSGEYQKALNALEHVDAQHPRNEHLPLLKKYTSYLLAPSDATARSETFRECVRIYRKGLNEPLDEISVQMLADILTHMKPSESNYSNSELEALMLYEYQNNNCSKVTQLTRQYPNNSTALSILAHLSTLDLDGIVVANDAQKLELALKSLAFEKDLECRKHQRVFVYKMLKKATYNTRPDEQLVNLMSVIFDTCLQDEDKSNEALYIKEQAAAVLGGYAYLQKDLKALKRVFDSISEECRDKNLYRAQLAETADTTAGYQTAFQLYTNLAAETYSHEEAQRILVSSYLEGSPVVGHQRNFRMAEEYALRLSQNANATLHQRGIAHEVLGVGAINTILKTKDSLKNLLASKEENPNFAAQLAQNKSDTKETYGYGSRCCELAIEGERYEALFLYLQLLNHMVEYAQLTGDDDSVQQYHTLAESWYQKYVETPQLWEHSELALPFVQEAMKILPHHMAYLITQKMLPNIEIMKIQKGREGASNFVGNIHEIINALELSKIHYKKYGFESLQAMDQAIQKSLVAHGGTIKPSASALGGLMVAHNLLKGAQEDIKARLQQEKEKPVNHIDLVVPKTDNPNLVVQAMHKADTAQLQELFHAHKDDPEMWNSVATGLDFSMQGIKADQKNLAKILKDVIKNVDKPSLIDGNSEFEILYDFNNLIEKIASNVKKDPVLYGFKNEQEYCVTRSLLEVKIKQRMVLPELAAIPKNSSEALKYYETFFASCDEKTDLSKMHKIALKALQQFPHLGKKICNALLKQGLQTESPRLVDSLNVLTIPMFMGDEVTKYGFNGAVDRAQLCVDMLSLYGKWYKKKDIKIVDSDQSNGNTKK